MTTTELIIAFLLEDDDQSEHEHLDAGDEWKQEWAIQVGRNRTVYSGEDRWDALINAFRSGELPEYATEIELIRDQQNAWKNHNVEIVKRPNRIIHPLGGETYDYDAQWKSLIPTRVMTGDDVLDVYQRTKKYRKGSLNREKLMQQVRQMAAKLESQRLRLPIHQPLSRRLL